MVQNTTDELSAMAKTLEQSGDYRVLRRLVPRDIITAVAPDQKTKIGVLLDV
jgi:hypothetical protein